MSKRREDPPLPRWNVKYSPTPEVSVSLDFLRARDGVKRPSQGERVQLVRDSRQRHRGFVPDGESSTHKYAEFEVADVQHEGTPRERYILKAKE